MEIDMDKVLNYLVEKMSTQNHTVVVIAEGLGDTLIKGEGFDAGGNKKLADVGPWFKTQVEAHFKERGLPLSIKFIDPSYQVRAVPADTFDSVYCSVLAQNAVHAAMAGYTGITVGKIDENYVVLPIQAITELPSKIVDVQGKLFSRMLVCTGQPPLGQDDVFSRQVSNESVTVKSYRKSASAARRGSLYSRQATESFGGGQNKDYLSDPLDKEDVFMEKDVITRYELQNLSTREPGANMPSPFETRLPGVVRYKDGNSWATTSVWKRNDETKGSQHCQFLRAGARQTLYWDPSTVKAAIVNCGGICPGLNSVIRELVRMLDFYGCQEVYGIIGGYKGVMEPENWMKLTPKYVEEMHLKGGSFLISDRGNPPHIEMAKMYKAKGITHVYIIGGDGTHKGVMQTYEQMLNIDYKCSMCGIPKTIDNDIALLDFTFGFHTAVDKAVEAIDAAYVEAECNANCMGLVKLMGRHAGFIAMHACLAARNVDLCLVPEMYIDMETVKAHIAELMEKRPHCVVVIAEGLGDTLIKSQGADAGGNKSLADIGPWFKKQVEAHMKALKRPFTCKYIDPSYMIRASPPDSFDSVYCSNLAMAAVNGCFAGYTGFTVGKISNHYVMIPIDEITGRKSKTIHLGSHWFARLVYTTKQPSMAMRPDSAKAAIQAVLQDACCKTDDGTGHVEKSTVRELLLSVGMSGDHVDKLLAYDAFGSNGKIHYGKLTAWLAA
jgi:6-phosphofructokinase 1